MGSHQVIGTDSDEQFSHADSKDVVLKASMAKDPSLDVYASTNPLKPLSSQFMIRSQQNQLVLQKSSDDKSAGMPSPLSQRKRKSPKSTATNRLSHSMRADERQKEEIK